MTESLRFVSLVSVLIHIHAGTDWWSTRLQTQQYVHIKSLRKLQSKRNWWRFDNNIKIHSSYFLSPGNVPIDWGSRYFNRPGQPLETPAHLNFLKQSVLCSNSPLHKLHVVVQCSSQRINVCRLWIRKNKPWEPRFSGLHMMLIGNHMQSTTKI